MTIKQLKEIIKDLPDDMPVCIMHDNPQETNFDKESINIGEHFDFVLWEIEVAYKDQEEHLYISDKDGTKREITLVIH